MKRNELEKIILAKHRELKLVNLKHLKKEHLEYWINENQVTLPVNILVNIFAERNERATINQRLNRENFGLNAKLKAFTDWSKSEIIQGFKRVFGRVTKADDEILGEIGAVSTESVREDMEKAEQVIEHAQNIAEQYQNKYGKL